MVAGIKEKASTHNDAKAIAQITAGQSVEQNWDCSHIENDEEEDDWQKENQMEVQRDEDDKLEETLARRMEGASLQVVVMQKVPELVIHERVSKGEKVKCTKARRTWMDGLLKK